VGEGRARLQQAIAGVGSEPTPALGRALRWAAELAIRGGDIEAAARLAQGALAVSDAVGDPLGRALAIHAVARVDQYHERWDAAATLYGEELSVWRETGNPRAIGMVLVELAEVAFGQGDLARARAMMIEAAALFRQADEQTWLAATDLYLGLFAVAERRFGEAARCFHACLSGYDAAGDAFLQSPLVGLARVAIEAGRLTTTAQLLGAADAELERTGMRFDRFEQVGRDHAEAAARAVLGDVGFAAAYASGRTLSRDAWFAAADDVVASLEAGDAARPELRGGDMTGLTRREQEVLTLVAEGLSDREVAAALFVTPGTVRSHLTGIYGKLQVGSRTAAVAAARRLGII
jgi:non-specific serine/threonine protein kinase